MEEDGDPCCLQKMGRLAGEVMGKVELCTALLILLMKQTKLED